MHIRQGQSSSFDGSKLTSRPYWIAGLFLGLSAAGCGGFNGSEAFEEVGSEATGVGQCIGASAQNVPNMQVYDVRTDNLAGTYFQGATNNHYCDGHDGAVPWNGASSEVWAPSTNLQSAMTAWLGEGEIIMGYVQDSNGEYQPVLNETYPHPSTYPISSGGWGVRESGHYMGLCRHSRGECLLACNGTRMVCRLGQRKSEEQIRQDCFGEFPEPLNTGSGACSASQHTFSVDYTNVTEWVYNGNAMCSDIQSCYGSSGGSSGGMLLSDANSGLAITPSGGANHGAVLSLSSLCSETNPDCTWTYQDGMLLSDRNPNLAINAWGGAADGRVLRLHSGCTASNPDCTWTLRNGVFYSDRNPNLAIHAPASHGSTVSLNGGCNATNSTCTWTYRGFMSFSDNGTNLAINAWGGAAHGTYVRLHNGCDANNPDCRWTIQRGMITSVRNPALSINAWGGATHLRHLRLHSGCAPSNPDCTWTFSRGRILSDRNPSLGINSYGGARHGAYLRLYNGCPVSNPDCTFTERGL